MHEKSESVQRKDGKWVNVYGRDAESDYKGQPLPLHYIFEKPSYDTVKQAVAAARKRSALNDNPEKAYQLLRPERK